MRVDAPSKRVVNVDDGDSKVADAEQMQELATGGDRTPRSEAEQALHRAYRLKRHASCRVRWHHAE